MNTNYPNESDRHVALAVMSIVEEGIDGGTIPPPLDALPHRTLRSGDEMK